MRITGRFYLSAVHRLLGHVLYCSAVTLHLMENWSMMSFAHCIQSICLSCHLVRVWTLTHCREAGSLVPWLSYINVSPHGPSLFLSAVCSTGIPSSHLGPVAMAIVRTHLESVTMAIGLQMSCLMSIASLSNFKVGVGDHKHTFGFNQAWVCTKIGRAGELEKGKEREYIPSCSNCPQAPSLIRQVVLSWPLLSEVAQNNR